MSRSNKLTAKVINTNSTLSTKKRRNNLLECAGHTRLYLFVAHDETTLFVSCDQHHFLIRTRIQLVEAGKYVCEVQKWISMLVHLMEDIVSEKLDDIPITCF